MLNRLLESAVKNRLWLFLICATICALGLVAAQSLPIDAVPDITNVQVMVNTKTGALDPEKIEKLVTYPIETEMAGLPKAEDIRSLSKYGLSQVTVVFNDSMDVYFARQLVNERLQNVRATLPEGLSPELAPVTTGLGEVLMYAVELRQNSDTREKDEKEKLTYLREVQDFIIRPQLKRLAGVADVDTNGGFLKQIHINVFPERLEAYGLSFEKFISKIESLGESFGGGYIQKEGSQVIIRATGHLAGLDTIRNLPLSLNVKGNLIRIRDVADVSVDHALRVGAATLQGQETVLGTVLMRSGANSRKVASSAEQALTQEIQLPEDVKVSILYSRSKLVDATIRTILKNLSEGAAFVVLALLLLLGNIRAALIVAISIPISMLFALKGMEVLGISANLMSLGAIDFGLLVDGAVVLVENIVVRIEHFNESHRERAMTKDEKLKTVLDASHEVIQPIVLGLFIIMLVYVPILYLEGIEGKMFKPMAGTVLLAMGGSLLVTLLLIPSLAYLFLPVLIKTAEKTAGEKSEKHFKSNKDPWLFALLRKLYQPALRFAMKHSWIVVLITVLPAIVAVFLYFRLGSDFVPQLDEGDLVINLSREPQQDIDTSVSWQKRAERLMMTFPEIDHVFSRMGTPESALDPMGPYLADSFVILKKNPADWPLIEGVRRTKSDLLEAITKKVLEDNPNQEAASSQPIAMRFNEILEGSRADVSLRILGPDLDKLLEYSERAKKALEGIKGIFSIEADPLTQLTKSPVLDVVLNYNRMAQYGVSLKDVNGILEAAMGGREVGSYYEGDRRFPLILHLDESLRNSLDEIRSIPVELPEGGTVPLSAVTDIQEQEQVTTVARSAARRYAAISIYLKNRDIGSFVTEAQARLKSALQLPSGYEMSWGGQFKNLERAKQTLRVIIPGTLLLIFALLLRNFGTLRHALLVFSAIPFAMVGGVFSLYFRGIPFSVSASVGFIALIGIATLNSMVMVSFFNQLRAQGESIDSTILTGALQRLRPVAMTALVASLGFLPMALNTGTGAEVQRPLATVVIGGLVTSTLLTLIVVPILYRWVETSSQQT